MKDKIVEILNPQVSIKSTKSVRQLAEEIAQLYSAGEEVYVKFTPDSRKGSDTGLYLYKDHPNYSEPLFNAHLKKLTRPTVTEGEKWKRPTDKQVIDICILFNDGKLEAEKLADMVAPIDFILDRLFENGDVTIPSSKETTKTKER
jgi:hypothetical protein